jgi:glycopeptide antibiotics resistance protein
VCIAHATPQPDLGRRGVRLTTATRAILGAATTAILIATLRPDFSREVQSWTNCILCGERGTADALVNLILFAPFGVGLRLARLPLRRAVLTGALLSGLVELAQTVIPGRDPSLGDVLFDTLGTAVGFVLAARAPQLARLPDVAAARLSLAFAVLLALVVVATGILLQPSFPQSLYYGQWTPNLGHLEWYRGKVLTASVGGIPVDSTRLDNSAAVREALLDSVAVAVQAVAGPVVPRLASLFSIADDRQRGILLIGPDRQDLVFRYRKRAADWRLDEPDIRLVGGMLGVSPGDTLAVMQWTLASGGRCLSTPIRHECGLGFTVGSAWGLLYYVGHFPPWLRGLFGFLAVALPLVPVGFFLRLRWESGASAGLAAAALLWLPATVALLPTQPHEWSGALFGLLAGQLAFRVVR